MDRGVIKILSNKPSETFDCGENFAKILLKGDVIGLHGDLGSGKTLFIQGVCRGLDVLNLVTSPSFTLVQEYLGKLPVSHFDFYRLQSAREIEDLDLDQYFEKEGVSLIEWAERGESLLPVDRFSIYIDRIFENNQIIENQRIISINGPAHRGLDRLDL
jgi:tRNA threonylcarbamoyladenosine biosynthesis protein TsaE